MELRILGPVEVRSGGAPVSLGGPKPTTLLVTLAVEANRPVPIGELVDSIWGDDPPTKAVGTVHAYLSRLRRALAQTGDDGRRRILNDGGSSYRLRLEPDELDIEVFRRQHARGRVAAAAGRLQQASDHLRAAVDLWRGPVTHRMPGTLAAARLAELSETRVNVFEEWVAVELLLGRYAEAIPELRRMVAAHPLRERLVGQLMLALSRVGQQAAALEVFQAARAVLVAEVGLEPGPELQQLQCQILGGAPAPHQKASARRWSHHGLLHDVDDFIGRTVELRRLTTPAPGDGPAIRSITGMAGVGKTTVAVRAAHVLAERYPDAQLYLDLYAHRTGRGPLDPSAALEILLSAIGVPKETIPDTVEARAALWRAEMAGRRAVLVLDDVVDAAQVGPLLPGNATCVVLITSRHRQMHVDGTASLTLELPPTSDAVALFAKVLGEERACAEPEAVTEAARLCGYLPLAIRMAATRLRQRPSWTVADLNRRLRDERRRLAELSFHERGVITAFTSSYELLDAKARNLFRLLGLHRCGDFDDYVAGAMAGIAPTEASRLLETLVDAHLLEHRRCTRYRFHGLMRAFASQQASVEESLGERMAVELRVLDYYLHTMNSVHRTLFPDSERVSLGAPVPGVSPRFFSGRKQALDWREDERRNVSASVWGSQRWGERNTSQWNEAYRRLHVVGRMTFPVTLVASEERSALVAEAQILNDLAVFAAWAGRGEDAVTCHRRALALHRTLGYRLAEAASLGGLGLAQLGLDNLVEAAGCYWQAVEIFEELGEPWGVGTTYTCLAAVDRKRGELSRAVAHATTAIEVLSTLNDHRDLGHAFILLGDLLRERGDVTDAERQWLAALAIFDELDEATADEIRAHLRTAR